MATKDTSSILRAKAESQLETKLSIQPNHHENGDSSRLLHELQVHQIELELQNEQLLQSRVELEQSRDRYVEFYDFAPVGYITLSRDGVIDEINLTAATLLGIKRNKLKHLSFSSLVSTEDADRWYVQFMQVLNSDKTESCELALKRFDGTSFYARLDCLSQIKNGKVTGVHIVIIDTTQSKITENSLRIAAIAFESQEGMVITDVAGTILKVNRAYTAITGYTAEELVGKNPRILRSGRQDEKFYDEMWRTVLITGCWEGEIWNKRKNGEIYPERLLITAVKNAGGKTTNYVGTMTDITLTRAAANEIEHLAFYDVLTRLPNRRLLIDRLSLALSSSLRSGKEGALLLLDLDNFKTLNDTLGHETGDLLLQQAAQRIESTVREGDTVARLGGDEFVVMLENLSAQRLEAAAQTEAIGVKILAALNQTYQLGTHNYHCTTSIGATLFGDHKTDLEELLKQADISMYQAKKAGRNALRFFDLQMQASINARAALETDLRNAIEKRQFALYYQVQVDDAGKALGAEVLIRWQHPEMGLVSPAQFIPLAEETGLISSIGQWVLETSCIQLNEWQKNPLTQQLTISVNVSAKQFHEVNFAMQVQNIVKHCAINPALLKLEPTESVLLEDIEATVETMNALKLIGVHFALDDFGTGFSSLQYLKKLPLNQLKIDQTFVRDLVTDHNDQAIVRTIIAMAQSMNLQVIAEGVETEEQHQILLNCGCKHFQGYLFGKPVTIDEFEKSIMNS